MALVLDGFNGLFEHLLNWLLRFGLESTELFLQQIAFAVMKLSGLDIANRLTSVDATFTDGIIGSAQPAKDVPTLTFFIPIESAPRLIGGDERKDLSGSRRFFNGHDEPYILIAYKYILK